MENSTPVCKRGFRNESFYSRNVIQTEKIIGKEHIHFKKSIYSYREKN